MATAGWKAAMICGRYHVRAFRHLSSCSNGISVGGVRKSIGLVNDDVRFFSKGSYQMKKKEEDAEEELSWDEKKKAAKEHRRFLYEKKMARQESLKTRRGPNKGPKRKQFRDWFEPMRQAQLFQDREARRLNLPWKIRVATIIERLPVILPDKPKWQKDYIELRDYLNTFGKIYPKELGFQADDIAETMGHPTTEEDLLALLPEGFQPAPRETEADKTGDVKTLDRKLKTRVYLIIQEDSSWTFPTATVREDSTETLLAAAKRALRQAVGSNMDILYLSNCPMAVDTIVYPKDKRETYYGEKIFYIKAQRDDGDVDPEQLQSLDHAWLAREEIVDRVRQQNGDDASKFYHHIL